jgi:hypothetical protein
MKALYALYALALVFLSVPALAIDWYEPNAAITEFDHASPIAAYQTIPSEDESIDPTFDFASEMKESATIATIDPAEIWHEFDYDVKDGVKVAKADPIPQGVDQEMTASIPAPQAILGDDYVEEALFGTGALPY